MYYEEKVIDGHLYSRTSPTGEWLAIGGPKAAAFYAMRDLTREECYDIIRHLEL
jgi:hypothetical protein